MEYWKRAADLGSREAMIRLIFANVLDEPNNPKVKEYVKVVKDAVNEGSVLAQTVLAYCYEEGIGVRKNKGTAANLYRSAAQRGNETAYNSLRRMYNEMRPADEEFHIYE